MTASMRWFQEGRNLHVFCELPDERINVFKLIPMRDIEDVSMQHVSPNGDVITIKAEERVLHKIVKSLQNLVGTVPNPSEGDNSNPFIG